MSENSKTRLGTERIGKLLFELSVPAITAQIINVLYNIVDRAYIGHIPEVGTQALTGVGVTMPVVMAISAFAALAAMGSAPRAGIMMGKKDYDAAEKIMGGSLFTLIVLAAALTASILLFGENILMMFGASAQTITYALDYINVYALGTIFVQLTLGLNAFISIQGFAKTSMLTVMIGAALNIALDPVFIFVLGMGVKGAAFATILSQGVSCIWVLSFLSSKKSILHIKRKNLRFNRKIMFPCIALGMSPFIMQFTESILFVCFNSSLQKYGGDLAVGAMTILSSAMQFSMLPLQGLTQGAQPVISYNYGAGKRERVRKAFRILLMCCCVYSVSFWCICMFAPQPLVMIFADSQELIEFTTWAIRIYMAVSCILGIQVACQQTFVAIGNAKTSMFLALLRKVFLLIPLIYLLPHLLQDQVMAVFLAEPVADTIAVTATAVLFFFQYRKLKDQSADQRPEAPQGSTS
ncbi:MAG: MATE family efflux transporter [Firmicutes bacterium]|nr:MATE family efflux transporter [Lachnospiraceae bacterium]MDD6066537.1 MATE family efflux transporter [Bacillota bacterium]MDY2818977.1 MATE family efflux transporter [Hominisplanchenecus sp.]